MNTQSTAMTFVTMIATIIPMSLLFWIIAISGGPSHSSFEHEIETPSPIRWFLSIFSPVVIAMYGKKKKSLDTSGAITALFVGFIMTLSSYTFFVIQIGMFALCSKATKIRSKEKKKIEGDFKEGGQRNWIQVVANGGVPAFLSLLYLLEKGVGGEIPINFTQDYNASWFSVAVMGAVACATGDSLSSEIGSVFGSHQPFLCALSLKRVPRGTNGGITIVGLISSGIGGFAIGLLHYISLLVLLPRDVLAHAPSQLPILVVGIVSGVAGSMIDSFLGAHFQYSGRDTVTGKIVEVATDRVEHISGVAMLDNHSVNLLSVLVTGLITPRIAMIVWAMYEPGSVPFS